MWLPPNTRAEAMPWDDRLEIINSRWVFHRSASPNGFEALQRIVNGECGVTLNTEYRHELIGEILDGRKSVRCLTHGDADEEKTKKGNYERLNFHSKLEINLSLPVRRMNRRALGLGVDSI